MKYFNVFELGNMTVRRGQFVRSVLATSVAAAYGGRPALGASDATASDITVAAPNLFPESLAYAGSTQRFYVGSVRYGRVSSVDMSGKLQTLSDDPALVSTFGIFADERRGLVYVCATDIGLGVNSQPASVGRTCRLVSLDARSGKVVRNVDLIGALDGKHLPNDAAAAGDGTVYVTDSWAPLVYRVSPEGRPEVFARDEGFTPPGGNLAGLDGIAIAASGTIIVNHIINGTFFRIDPSSKSVSRVTLAGDRLLPGADGMRFAADGRLFVAQNTLNGPKGRNAVNVLVTSDDWRTAAVASEQLLSNTTYQTVQTPAGMYGVQSRLEELLKDPKTPNVSSFRIARMPG